jgi:Ca2+-transporting ATPase
LRRYAEVEVESRELVRGDIVKLGTGDVVPADLRMIKVGGCAG